MLTDGNPLLHEQALDTPLWILLSYAETTILRNLDDGTSADGTTDT
ncbi:MAG: hypothetical protein H9535_19630 [Ignavibacteria bacterium]|nr:hypothetical protein [Ignavibacteria bacterium]